MIGLQKEDQKKRAEQEISPPQVMSHSIFQSDYTRVGAAILSGLLMALSFPGFNHSSLAFLALVPLMYALQSLSIKRAAWMGLLTGFTFFMASLSWLHNLTRTVDSIGMQVCALAGYVLLALYCALYFIPFSIGAAVAMRKWVGDDLLNNVRFMFATSTIWVGAEYARSVLLTGFPWNPLGVSQYGNGAIIQIAEFGGVYIVSALIVWMNAALYVTFKQYTHGTRTRKYRPHFEIMIGLLPLALSLMFGMKSVFHKTFNEETVSVALIQPNIPQTVKWDEGMADDIRTTLAELTETATRLPDLDLVIWPESAVPDLMYANLGFGYSAEAMRLVDIPVPLLTGVNYFDSSSTNLYNSSVLLDVNGRGVGIYHKQHLVPFGEYVPFPGIKKFTAVEWENTPGTISTVFTLPHKAPFSVLICFEDTIAPLASKAVRAGARWLVNQTNDGWFDPSSESEQHLAHAVFRCIENRVPMARCCNTGVSCFIDAYGLISYTAHPESKLDVRTEGFSIGNIMPRPAGLEETFYTRHGDLFARICLAGAAVAFYVLCFHGRKKRKKDL